MENFRIFKTLDERIEEAKKEQMNNNKEKLDLQDEYKYKYINLQKEYNKYKEDTRKYLLEYDELKWKYKELEYNFLNLHKN